MASAGDLPPLSSHAASPDQGEGIAVGLPTGAFDGVAEIASRLLDVPVALVIVAQDAQHRLRGAYGVDGSSISGEWLAATRAIDRHFHERFGPLAIADSWVDGAEAPLQGASQPMRACLAVPLRMVQGETVGALCVFDDEPRQWTDRDAESLATLARGVAAELGAQSQLQPAQAAEPARRDAARGLNEVLESIDQGYYRLDDNWRLIYVNAKAEQLWQRRRASLLGRTMFEAFPEFAGSESHLAHERTLAERRPVRLQTVSAIIGSPIEISIHPARGGLSVYFRDVSERERLEAELRERDEILTLAERSAGIGVWDIDLQFGTVRGTPQFFRIMGLEPTTDSVEIDRLRRLRHPDDRERVLEGFRKAVDSGMDAYEMEYRIRRPDGETRWIFGRGRVIRDASGQPLRYSGVDIDITERKRAEEHRQLLMRELDHRVKNVLATVQAIAAQTFRGSAVAAELRETFEKRILALAKAHGLLTADNWSGAELHEIVTETLQTFGHSAPGIGRVSVDGIKIRLAPRDALAFAMTMHELATNAAKYGALSNDVGKIEIAWKVEGQPPQHLRFRWKEIGGPRVAPPVSRGFGTQLIKVVLPRELNGEVRLDFDVDGVRCEIDMPLGGEEALEDAGCR